MLSLDSEDLSLLQSILQKYPYTFYAYGSRVKGKNKNFSDLDLCVMESISDDELFVLIHDLEESNLPIKVDVKRWFIDMNAQFRSMIERDLVRVIVSKYDET